MYATDLTDGQWELLKPLFEVGHDPKIGGRPRSYLLRAVVDAVLYVSKTGCQWRMLPDSFAPWGSVYGYFRKWRLAGVWDTALARLREACRIQSGRDAQPTAAIIDSQSVKTTSWGRRRGFDAGKKVKGRKRHIAVGTQGNLIAVLVHSAGIQDRRGARLLLVRLFAMFATLRAVWADGGYAGFLVDWAKGMFGWALSIVKRTDAMHGKFVVHRGVGWLSAPSLGSGIPDDFPRITNGCPTPPRCLSKLPRCIAFCAGAGRFLNSF